jgi:integrase
MLQNVKRRPTTGTAPKGAAGPRAKGSGGVFPVRPGVWRVDIELPRDTVTGKRRRISRNIEGTRNEAEVALSRLRVADREKRLPTGGTSARSVRAALDLYITAAETGQLELAPRTIVTTRSAANTMCSVLLLGDRPFGRLTLSRLTWQDIEQMYSMMRSQGLSVDWVRRSATVLSRTLEFARKRGLIDSNPAKDATRPRSTRSKPHSPTAAEVRSTLDFVRSQDAEFADAVTVLVSTGMRKGELLGLQWENFDAGNAELHVESAITDAGSGRGILRKPTKRSDWRDVPLTAQALAAIHRQHERARERGAMIESTDYVFSNPLDSSLPYRPDTFSDRWLAELDPVCWTRGFVRFRVVGVGASGQCTRLG